MTERAVVLADFRSIELSQPVRQERLVSYLAWLLASARCAADGVTSRERAAAVLAELQARMLRYAVGPNFIARRQFNAFPGSEDALGSRARKPELPAGFEDLATRPLGPGLDVRMRRFETLALEVFERFYQAKSRAPDDLIHVCCSGYASPSPAQRLLASKRWYSTGVVHSYHMDCYGAFPAIRTAAGLLLGSPGTRSEPKTRVDIVHTEYLSAHLATLKDEPGDLVTMTLFGDGFIGYSLYPLDVYRRERVLGPGLRVLACDEQLIPDSSDEMTWRLGPQQFDLCLSKGVPLLIREHVVGFTRRLCARAGIDLEREKSRLLFAIHPGGPKILDHCRDALGIAEDQIAAARNVFFALGNMSSATVPHILLQLSRDSSVPPGTRIVALGFGPGLTATGALLEKIDGAD
jgi:predicted naringenin-chalcone synthase